MDALSRLAENDVIERLLDRDATLFTQNPAVAGEISQWLGWMGLASSAPIALDVVETATRDIRSDLTDVVVLGMGGSSLASAVIGQTLPHPDVRLHVLDTVSPISVRRVLEDIDPATTAVVVASKSGSTIEPNALYAVFREHFDRALGDASGSRFLAITDPSSSLEGLAHDDGFSAVIPSPKDVGGRFSALTVFGLTPATLIGADVHGMIASAQAMERLCTSTSPSDNPAAELAAFIADNHAIGRDKLTLLMSSGCSALGAWIEQLVAESLGKDGRGVVPVIETANGLQRHGTDRAIVVMREPDDLTMSEQVASPAGTTPVLDILVEPERGIGGEFVRWEYAVAMAAVLLGVNAFDQPNVAESKAATDAVLEGSLTAAQPQASADGVDMTLAGRLADRPLAPSSVQGALDVLLRSLEAGDYLAILAYLPDEPDLLEALHDAARRTSVATGSAVCVELGPRYLHSTGQLHKGGPDNGVYLMITSAISADIEVPGRPWTLGGLHRAQATGDLNVLTARGRRVLRLDLPDASANSVREVARALVRAAESLHEG